MAAGISSSQVTKSLVPSVGSDRHNLMEMVQRSGLPPARQKMAETVSMDIAPDKTQGGMNGLIGKWGR
jgi:hypothetical protein